MKNDRIWHFLLDYYACLEQSVTLPLVFCQNETIKKCKASALHSKNCFSNSWWYTATVRAFSYSIKKLHFYGIGKCSFDNRALCTNIFIEYILITTYYPEDRLPEADNSMYHTDVM